MRSALLPSRRCSPPPVGAFALACALLLPALVAGAPANALGQAREAVAVQREGAAAQQQLDPAPPQAPSGQPALSKQVFRLDESFPRRTERALSRIPAPLNADPVAARLAEAYRRTGRAETVRKSSYVMYPFGKTEPVVTCAPLRACTIELQEGERVISVIAGDTGRWLISETATGAAGRTPLIAVKPMEWNITTNMVLSTDRRIYDVTLDAPPEGEAEPEANPTSYYTARVKFYYPEDFVRQTQRRQQLAQAARQDQRRRAARTVPVAGGASLTDLNFNYRWSEGGLPLGAARGLRRRPPHLRQAARFGGGRRDSAPLRREPLGEPRNRQLHDPQQHLRRRPGDEQGRLGRRHRRAQEVSRPAAREEGPQESAPRNPQRRAGLRARPVAARRVRRAEALTPSPPPRAPHLLDILFRHV